MEKVENREREERGKGRGRGKGERRDYRFFAMHVHQGTYGVILSEYSTVKYT